MSAPRETEKTEGEETAASVEGDDAAAHGASEPEVDRGALSPFLEGARDVAPMVLAVAPFGAVAGLAAVASGLGLGQALALSAFVNAGASQLAALQLFGQGAPIVMILATTFFVNLRFLMYSVTLVPELRGIHRGWRLLMGHMLVDQTFALAIRRFSEQPHRPGRVAYYLGLGLPLVLAWNGGTFAGAAFGTAVPEGWSLEFTIPLIFLALLMPAIRDRPGAVAALTGGAVAVASVPLPLNLGLMLAAFCGIGAGLLAERRWEP